MNTTELDLPPEGHMASVNGMEMYYELHGEGPPLVLLHGFTHTSHNWKPYIADFGQGFQLIIPDLRGHGRSTNLTDEFTCRQCADDLFALLDRLGYEQCKGIGYSSGGDVLLHMATQQPTRVAAMVLIGAHIYYSEQARSRFRTKTDAEWPWDSLRKRHARGDEQVRWLVDQFRSWQHSYDDMNFTPPYLSTIAAKTLIVQGDRDNQSPIRNAAEMYASIPHAYLWIVPNGGHLPISGKHKTAFTQTALEFLRGEWETH